MTRKDRKKYVSRAFQRCVLCVKSENPSDVILRHLGTVSHNESCFMGQGDMFQPGLPHFAVGPVVTGFGRGSKQLKIPTANYPDEVVKNLPEEVGMGVYCGWASVNKKEVHKMIVNIGSHPIYGHMRKTMETHIMHNFEGDFFGSELRIVILAFLRSNKLITSIDDLLAGVQSDITNAAKILDKPQFAAYRTNSFFTSDDQEQKTNIETKYNLTGLCGNIVNCTVL